MSTSRSKLKRINDPLHGAIFLNEVEFAVASTPTFLRLGNVKQLGLGGYVYPGATYSRLSHSLGACHVLGHMLDAIERNANVSLSDEDRVLTRLAALLHDVGHYPFSHATEEVVTSLAPSLLEGGSGETGSPVSYFDDHEELGRYLITSAPDIVAAIESHGVAPSDVLARLDGTDRTSLNLLVSSDLDCDRLDYLRRTALNAGMPFGGIDAEYLIDNMSLDGDQLLCLRRRAIGSADHFLVSRMYDFETLPFHKAVVGFEEALKIVMRGMAKHGYLRLDRQSIEAMITDGSWRRFDDQLAMTNIRNFADNLKSIGDGHLYAPFVGAVLDRKAPKLIFGCEYFEALSLKSNDEFSRTYASVVALAKRVLVANGVAEHLIVPWKKTFRLLEGKESGKRIRIERGAGRSDTIDEDKSTLSSQLENYGRRHIRVYACLNEYDDPKGERDRLRGLLEEALLREGLLAEHIRPIVRSNPWRAVG